MATRKGAEEAPLWNTYYIGPNASDHAFLQSLAGIPIAYAPQWEHGTGDAPDGLSGILLDAARPDEPGQRKLIIISTQQHAGARTADDIITSLQKYNTERLRGWIAMLIVGPPGENLADFVNRHELIVDAIPLNGDTMTSERLYVAIKEYEERIKRNTLLHGHLAQKGAERFSPGKFPRPRVQ